MGIFPDQGYFQNGKSLVCRYFQIKNISISGTSDEGYFQIEDISRSEIFQDWGYFQIQDISRTKIFSDQGYFQIWDISRLGIFPD